MQNSPERLLAGIAQSLRDSVLPSTSDPYAQGQIRAAAEVLDNLAPRVDWRTDDLREPLAELLALLAAAAESAPDLELPHTRAWLPRAQCAGDRLARRPAPAERSALAAWGEGLQALAEVQQWLARPSTQEPGLQRRLREFLRNDFERERGLLRTGMFRQGQAGR
jgi:hypothetical protein